MNSHFTSAVMEKEAASQILQMDRRKSEALSQGKVLLKTCKGGSSISSRTKWKSSSFLFSSALKAKKLPFLCYKAKQDSVVSL